MNRKLFSQNFIILLIGQSLSMFGNNIIRFAISLYILEETQSASAYGIVTAVSYIPTILFSPFGGVLADRCNKKDLMIFLDSSYCAIAIIMGSLFQRQGSFFLAASLLLLLSVVSSFEGPVSSACIPLIQHGENLTRANAISNQISSLSDLIAPFLSGILYGITGSSRFHTLMYLCAVLFLLAAGTELMLNIPQAPSTKYFTITETIRLDLRAVLHMIFKERKSIGETMLINGLMMFLVTPLSFHRSNLSYQCKITSSRILERNSPNSVSARLSYKCAGSLFRQYSRYFYLVWYAKSVPKDYDRPAYGCL